MNQSRPLRDLSLTDFAWVAQQAIYTNPILVTQQQRPETEQQAARQ